MKFIYERYHLPIMITENGLAANDTVSLDGSEPQTVNFNKTLLDKQPYMYSEFYPAVARRIVEKVVELPVGTSDIHELTIRPKHPGIVFEKIVVDFGGYQPQYLFGEETSVKRAN